jgi:sugar/nucleoside kinase (ribokinase family)
VILVAESQGERIVLWDRDPALTLRPEDLPRDLLSRARVVHVDAVDADAAIAAAWIAREAGAIVTSDIEAAGQQASALIAAVSVPIFAEDVPMALTGERSLEAALRALRRTHAGLLCVTLGARGAMLLDGDAIVSQPGFEVDVLDTTGAGDVFRAGLIAAMLRGDPPASMLRFATAAAALSCTRPGAVPSVPTRADVEAFLGSARQA